jgi:Fe2+ or Zn2+ uptake regulation protein
MEEIILDTRELEAPEPMGLVLRNLNILNETKYIHMIHRLEPLMLYSHLEQNNLHHKVILKNEDVHIYIWSDSFKDITTLEELS